MLPLRTAALPLLLLAGSLLATAQTAPPQGPTPGWIPRNLEQLGQRATFHTSFTFDRSMLHFADNFMDDSDDDTRRAVDKLNSITVHSYHFSSPGLYNPSALAAARSEYDATGWKHMMTAHSKGDPFSAGQTDLWISFAHMQVTGMVVLLTEPKDIEVISLDGNLSPLDLLHLRGHFGIPRFDGNGIAPAPAEPPQATNRRPEYQAPAPPPASAATQ
ncbi:MAG TPA: DUF4252 domain-containing protein [Acidobacteriaceae bacterium]|nr:DUF4252 domain-containing protein [Acidobacteriaceae bacterium]